MGNAHPNTTEASAGLAARVTQFNMMQLPGQPFGMHMGTSYLVNDLAADNTRLRAENAAIVAANAMLMVRCGALLAFVEGVRDHKPAIISGRHNGNRDPQDEVPDMIEADTFYAFQKDAAKLAPKPTKPKDTK